MYTFFILIDDLYTNYFSLFQNIQYKNKFHCWREFYYPKTESGVLKKLLSLKLLIMYLYRLYSFIWFIVLYIVKMDLETFENYIIFWFNAVKEINYAVLKLYDKQEKITDITVFKENIVLKLKGKIILKWQKKLFIPMNLKSWKKRNISVPLMLINWNLL